MTPTTASRIDCPHSNRRSRPALLRRDGDDLPRSRRDRLRSDVLGPVGASERSTFHRSRICMPSSSTAGCCSFCGRPLWRPPAGWPATASSGSPAWRSRPACASSGLAWPSAASSGSRPPARVTRHARSRLCPSQPLSLFAALFAAAIVNVKKPEVHKRLMLVATVSMLQAAIGRWFLLFLAPRDRRVRQARRLCPRSSFRCCPGLVTDLLIVAAMVHDRRTRGRVHPVYWYARSLRARRSTAARAAQHDQRVDARHPLAASRCRRSADRGERLPREKCRTSAVPECPGTGGIEVLLAHPGGPVLGQERRRGLVHSKGRDRGRRGAAGGSEERIRGRDGPPGRWRIPARSSRSNSQAASWCSPGPSAATSTHRRSRATCSRWNGRPSPAGRHSFPKSTGRPGFRSRSRSRRS